MCLVEKYDALAEMVIQGDPEPVRQETGRLLTSGEDPLTLINEGLIKGINEVGRRFKAGEMFVPEMMRSAMAMKAGLAVVKPLMEGRDVPSAGKVVIGTVKGDLHDIGKNLVVMMLESSGFTVVDLGVDTPVDAFVRAVREHSPGVVGMSALLTTTMPVMKQVIDALERENLRGSVKVVIGGAPVSPEFAREVGADAYAADAVAASDICREVCR